MSLAVGTVIYQWIMSNQNPSIVYTTKNWDTISVGDDYYDIYGNNLGTISNVEQSGFPTIYDNNAYPTLAWERTQGDTRSKTVRESFSQFSKFSDGNVTYSVKDAEARDDITSLTLEKQDTIIGAASSVTNNNLATSKALISDMFGKISASSVTSTELGYLSGVTSAVQTQLNAKAVYPSQSGNSGKFLTTNGSAVSWTTVNALPAQSGQSGKYLTTDGTTASWATVDALPSQSGQSGKYLTTNGTNASWTSITMPTVDQIYDGTSTNAQSGVAVKSAIDATISSVYKAAGSITFANRPSLSSSIEGNVYDITDAFTTTSDFVEGAGKTYPAGTNIVCINTATSDSAVYKWDVLTGIVDLSGYVPTSRKVNNKALNADISLTASDVGAVAANSAITGATKCKITYDSKGLVTSGANLTASDIPDISATYQTKITSSNKISADYISDGTTNKVVTATEKTTWSGKQDALVSGTNIKTVNGNSLLGSGNIDTLPSQSGNSGKFLTTNGSAVSWADTPTEIPTQTGNSGKFLTTNGTSTSWTSITIPTYTAGDYINITNDVISGKVSTNADLTTQNTSPTTFYAWYRDPNLYGGTYYSLSETPALNEDLYLYDSSTNTMTNVSDGVNGCVRDVKNDYSAIIPDSDYTWYDRDSSKDMNITLFEPSDAYAPSQKAVKTYVDSLIGDVESALNTINSGSPVSSFVNLTVTLTGTPGALNSFTINNTTYTYSNFTNNSMTISIPKDTSLSWSTTTDGGMGSITPSSGTINTSSDYTLTLSCSTISGGGGN